MLALVSRILAAWHAKETTTLFWLSTDFLIVYVTRDFMPSFETLVFNGTWKISLNSYVPWEFRISWQFRKYTFLIRYSESWLQVRITQRNLKTNKQTNKTSRQTEQPSTGTNQSPWGYEPDININPPGWLWCAQLWLRIATWNRPWRWSLHPFLVFHRLRLQKPSLAAGLNLRVETPLGIRTISWDHRKTQIFTQFLTVAKLQLWRINKWGTVLNTAGGHHDMKNCIEGSVH